MIVRDFDDMRIGTTPLSKLYYGHDLIWKRKDVEPDNEGLIIVTTYTNTFTIPSINETSITGTIDFGDGEIGSYNNSPIIHNYPYSDNWQIKIKAPFTSIKNSAFARDGTQLLMKEIIIPKGVTSIGGWAFQFCSSLTSVIIPDSVTSIGVSAFSYCNSLTSITIPDSVTSIEHSAFYGCERLKSIQLSDSMTRISSDMFSACIKLTSVIIPDTVTSIGDRAFNGCSSLTSVTIPDSVTSIGTYAFDFCVSLASVIIPPSVKTIAIFAFRNTGLTSVTIASNCTYYSKSFPSGCIINRY